MAERHPLYQGMTGHMFGEHSLPILQKGDANLVVGTYIVPEVFPELGDVFAPGAKVVHIDLNAYEIAKNHPVDLGVVADPKLTLALLGDALERDAARCEEGRDAPTPRTGGQGQGGAPPAELEQDRAVRDAVPLKMSRFMEELARAAPGDVVVFDEALTNSPAVSRYLPPSRTGSLLPDPRRLAGCRLPGRRSA